jgi:hypothetical protein
MREREKIVRPDRRYPNRRQSLPSTPIGPSEGINWRNRRVYCWNLEPTCTEERRRRCSAYFIDHNCWDLWATEYFPPGRRPCCHPDESDCSDCAVAAAKFDGPISVYVSFPSRRGNGGISASSGDSGIGCPHFYIQKNANAEGGDPEGRQSLKCQRRRGVTLHSSYVSEVCNVREYQECVFYGT